MEELLELAKDYPIQLTVDKIGVQLTLRCMDTKLKAEVDVEAEYFVDCNIWIKIAVLKCIAIMHEKIAKLP